MAYRDTAHHEHEHHEVKYVYIFIALCVFTGLSILVDALHGLPYAAKVVGVLAVAAAKASCVMLWFMHLKFEGNWKFILLAPTTILAIGLPIALMPDVAVNYYIKDVPQVDDYEQAMAHAPGGHSAPESSEDHPPNTEQPAPEKSH